MHVRNKFNVKGIIKLTEPGIYSDGGGLYMRVRKAGTRSWLYIGMLKGKRIEMGLGSVLDVSLAVAREKAREHRSSLLAGIDPLEQKRKAMIKAAPKLTFGEVADELLNNIEGSFRNEKHRKQWRSSVVRYAAPILEMPVNGIASEDILQLLSPIWNTKRETARRVRQRIEKILDAATVRGLRLGNNPARYKGHLEFLLPSKRAAEIKHHKALPFAELPSFIAKLRKRPATAARALEFTILTAARTGEVRGATWDEIDLEKRVWTIPGSRMKAGQTHDVPLNHRAIAILNDIRKSTEKPSDLIFTNQRGGELSNMAMAQLLKRMEYDITVHGFRSTFRDWAGETTSFAREDIEMALAHTIQSKTERAYRRGNALDKRRGLMAAWEVFCRK